MTHKIITYKSKTTAIILCLLLGTLGVHRWYLGNPWLGIMWPVLSLASLSIGAPLIVTALLLVDAIYLLCKGKAYYRRVKLLEVEV